jgi:hypothetical protein
LVLALFEEQVRNKRITFAAIPKNIVLRDLKQGLKMTAKKRILFIANEMSPYLELTEFSEIVNKLAIKSNDSGFEVRCIMPRFGVINERRHRLHEVVRLSGINVSVDNDDLPLQIKVENMFFMMNMKNGTRTMIFARFSFVKEPSKQ